MIKYLLITVLLLSGYGFMSTNNTGELVWGGCSIFAASPEVNTTPIAFPGAEGFGRFTTGGRGGRVIYVTNLNDTGVGSFRAAVTASGARIVVFKVSGIIELQSNISIKNGDITIAGQTAPGDGITIKNYTVVVDANNVIIRFLRFRMGDEKMTENDAIWGRRKQNIILDHCSMSWATDEASSFYDNTNFTMQWCVLSESLRNSVHDKGRHGYMGIWGGKSASFHHNLLAHHDSRNPRFNGSRYSNQPELEHVDYRNNVIYNWGANSAYAGEGGTYNMVNNYYKFGPATNSNVRARILQPNADSGTNSQAKGVWGTFYINGNFVNGNATVTSDNWQGVHPNTGNGGLPGGTKDGIKSSTEFASGHITTHSAHDAFDVVLDWSGASLKRDAVDARVVSEAKAGTFTHSGSNGSVNGLIDSQSDVGGWPVHNATDAPVDTDGDGMPDEWELLYGLNPNDSADGILYSINSMFTNVEVYINSLVQHIMEAKKVNGIANYSDNFEMYSSVRNISKGDVNVSAFPNPATDVLNVTSAQLINYVDVISIDGTVLSSQVFNANEITLSLGNFNKGVLFVKVVFNDGYHRVVRVVKR